MPACALAPGRTEMNNAAHVCMMPGSLRTKAVVLAQVQSNGVLDQLVRKWTTDIDQCREDQVCDVNERHSCMHGTIGS